MLRALLAVPGLLLLGLVLSDVVVTTLSPGAGGGLLTRSLAHRASALGRRAERRAGSGRRLLVAVGPAVLLLTSVTWVLLIWASWVLVFCASDGAVRVSQTSAPADLAGRVYFAGFVVSSLGVGDLVPGEGLWQVLTAGASFVGLAFITLSITYVLNVLSAATARRALARQVSGCGATGTAVVALHAQGGRLVDALSQRLQTWTATVLSVTEQHLTYPVLHTFHTADPGASPARALAALDDALLLLADGLAPHSRPPRSVVQPLQEALEHYTSTVSATARGAAQEQDPPVPDRRPLREAGLPLAPEAEWLAALGRHAGRRRRLARLVSADSWSWPA